MSAKRCWDFSCYISHRRKPAEHNSIRHHSFHFHSESPKTIWEFTWVHSTQCRHCRCVEQGYVECDRVAVGWTWGEFHHEIPHHGARHHGAHEATWNNTSYQHPPATGVFWWFWLAASKTSGKHLIFFDSLWRSKLPKKNQDVHSCQNGWNKLQVEKNTMKFEPSGTACCLTS